LRPLGQRQRGVMLPRDEPERSVADEVPGLRELVAVLVHDRLVDGQERGVRQLLDEPGLRRGQRDDQLVLADRLDADLVAKRVAVRLRRVARVVRLGSLDPAELVRVVGAQLRRDRAEPRVDVVLCGRRGTVLPADLRVQVQRHGAALDGPALRGAGLGPRRTSGSIRLNRMLDEVVSVARPASSDGGSAPTDIRNTPARPDLPVAAIEAPAAITARRLTSPANIIERFRILLLPPSEGAFVFPSRRLVWLCGADHRRREGSILTNVVGACAACYAAAHGVVSFLSRLPPLLV